MSYLSDLARAETDEERSRCAQNLPQLAKMFLNWKAGYGLPGGRSIYDFDVPTADCLLQLAQQFGGPGTIGSATNS